VKAGGWSFPLGIYPPARCRPHQNGRRARCGA
jgi:hypothetical protein